MKRPSLTRPPRSKRPPEVVRHVDESMDAYRRVVESGKGKRATRPGTNSTDRSDRD